MSNVVERFLKYIKYETTSNEKNEVTPSTPGQLIFAKELAQELKKIGLEDVWVGENSYVMATLPANTKKEIPTIGFISHLDTSPDMSGKNVQARIIKNYDGQDIILNQEENIVLSTDTFPEIKNYKGKTLITTDGTTLLGADDKAGIAEIITAVECLQKNPQIPHGEIKVCFTPDEEIGRGADHFDLKRFAADLAYTIDGGTLGELQYENFNAAGAKITIKGINVHPGSAKNKMKNSMLIAAELISALPEAETPARTEGYEGFYHLCSINGDVEKTTLSYIIRDFDRDNFNRRKEQLQKVVLTLKQKYGAETLNLEIKDQYYNMKEKITEVKYIVDIAAKAMEESGVKPLIEPIRGGTDGARLSFMGLPTPNIFTGGHNFHGKFEYIPTFAMEKAVEVIVKIIHLYAEKEN